MNINSEVLSYAQPKGLDAISTGAGCDYIVFTVESQHDTELSSPCLVMVSPFGDNSPNGLDDAAQVNIFPTDEWYSFIVVPFENGVLGIIRPKKT
jgi:hypothetical protein